MSALPPDAAPEAHASLPAPRAVRAGASLRGLRSQPPRFEFGVGVLAQLVRRRPTSPPRAGAPHSPSSRSTSRTRNVPAEVNSADPCIRAGQNSVKKRFLPGVDTRGSALDPAERPGCCVNARCSAASSLTDTYDSVPVRLLLCCAITPAGCQGVPPTSTGCPWYYELAGTQARWPGRPVVPSVWLPQPLLPSDALSFFLNL